MGRGWRDPASPLAFQDEQARLGSSAGVTVAGSSQASAAIPYIRGIGVRIAPRLDDQAVESEEDQYAEIEEDASGVGQQIGKHLLSVEIGLVEFHVDLRMATRNKRRRDALVSQSA